MSLLPAAGDARADEAKIVGYLLNAAHPQNGGRAAFFAAFGFAIDRWQVLRAALRMHPTANHVADVERSPHGIKYVVRCSTETPDGRDPCVTTIWIVDVIGPPRLVTAYP